MPALKKWMNFRFGTSFGSEGSEARVQRMVAFLKVSIAGSVDCL
jgi:hypothetical protein